MSNLIVPHRFHRSLPENKNGRDIIIGDLHGKLAKLNSLLEVLCFDKKIDRVICCGDLVDRGEDSLGCLKLTSEPWFESVIGNHELMLLNAHEDESAAMCAFHNGGEWYFLLQDGERMEAASLMRQLSITLDFVSGNKKIGVSHADIPEGWSWSEITQAGLRSDRDKLIEHILWSRRLMKPARDEEISTGKYHVHGINYVYHGHNILKDVYEIDNRVMIDTGSFIDAKPYRLSYHVWKNGERLPI